MKYAFYKFGNAFSRNRRETTVLLALCVLLGLPFLISGPAAIGAAAADRDLPIYNVKRDDKCVSLTFDAAWGNVKLR